MKYNIWLFTFSALIACGGADKTSGPANGEPAPDDPPASPAMVADVVSVEVSGNSGTYTFAVGIASPDQGCDQYADWWEVLSEDGELMYRRILLHSHVAEQPFVRTGGPVAVAPDQVVRVRAHMHPGGYGGVAFKGSVENGFQPAEPVPGFAAGAATLPPLPDGCNF